MSSDQHGLGMQKGKILNDKYISNFSCGVLSVFDTLLLLCTLYIKYILGTRLRLRVEFF